MPPTNIETITIMEPTESKAMPEIPLPLVHPLASLAPNNIINPPANPIKERFAKDFMPNNLSQAIEIFCLFEFDKREEKKAPKIIPITKASCQKLFIVGKQLVVAGIVLFKKDNSVQATLL